MWVHFFGTLTIFGIREEKPVHVLALLQIDLLLKIAKMCGMSCSSTACLVCMEGANDRFGIYLSLLVKPFAI